MEPMGISSAHHGRRQPTAGLPRLYHDAESLRNLLPSPERFRGSEVSAPASPVCRAARTKRPVEETDVCIDNGQPRSRRRAQMGQCRHRR